LFGPTPVREITRDDVRAFAAALERKGLGPKSRANALGTLHSLIEFAIDGGWMVGENPVKRVEKPALAETDPDVRFLETEEVEALLRAVPEDPLGRVERVMYLTAAWRVGRSGRTASTSACRTRSARSSAARGSAARSNRHRARDCRCAFSRN
jgi:hypothetical protein